MEPERPDAPRCILHIVEERETATSRYPRFPRREAVSVTHLSHVDNVQSSVDAGVDQGLVGQLVRSDDVRFHLARIYAGCRHGSFRVEHQYIDLSRARQQAIFELRGLSGENSSRPFVFFFTAAGDYDR